VHVYFKFPILLLDFGYHIIQLSIVYAVMSDKAHYLSLPMILCVGSGIKSDVTEQPYLKEEIYI
jgi:hypothetical protein